MKISSFHATALIRRILVTASIISITAISNTALWQTQAVAINDLSWNSNNIELAVARDNGTVEILNLAGQPSRTLNVSQERVISVAWSTTDSSRLAISTYLGPVQLLTVTSEGFDSVVLMTDQNSVREVEWNTDGTRLASLGESGGGATSISEVKIWDPNSGNLLETYEDGFSITDLAWHPQNPNLLAFTGVANNVGAEIILWDVANDTVLWSLQEADYGVTFIAWSPDGSQLASSTEGITDATYGTAPVRIHDSATGSPITTLPTGFSFRGPIAWSPSSYLAVSDGTEAQIWDVNSIQVIGSIEPNDFLNAIVWNADSYTLAYGADSGTVQIVAAPGVATPTPTATPTSGSITVQIAAGADDVNEDGGSFQRNYSEIWLGNGASVAHSYTGLRFTNVPLPQGATILSASLEFYVADEQWIYVEAMIAAEASDTSAPFSTSSRLAEREQSGGHSARSWRPVVAQVRDERERGSGAGGAAGPHLYDVSGIRADGRRAGSTEGNYPPSSHAISSGVSASSRAALLAADSSS